MSGHKLPHRPRPIEGESWPGYLLRLSNENGLRGLVSIATILGLTADRLLRNDIFEVSKGLQLLSPPVAIQDAQSNRGYLNMRTRVCSECLAGDKVPFVRARWDSPITLHCSHHRKLLVDTCPDCGHQLTYERGWIDRCRCGAAMKSWRSASAEAWMRDMYELIQAPETDSVPRLTFAPIDRVELHKADLLMRLVRQQRTQGISRLEKRISPSKFVARTDLDACKELFGQFPESVHASFSRWQSAGLRNAQLRLPAGSKLVDIWDKIRRDRDLSRAALREPVMQPPTGFVSKKRLMVETGLHPTAIDYLIEKGLLRGAEKLAGESRYRNRFFIPEAEYQGLLSLYKGTMSINEAADFAMLKTSTIRILGYSKAVQTFQFGKCTYVFRLKPTDISALIQRVLSKARRFTGSFETLVSLEEAITVVYRFDVKLPKRLLQEIAVGQVQVFVVNRSAIHLGECYLDSGGFREWCRTNDLVGARRVNTVPG